MKNREEIQKELQELSPFLSKLKAKEQKPEVPENYFHALPEQIWEQIKLQPMPERVVKQPDFWQKLLNTLRLLLQPRIAVSLATFAMLIFIGIYFFQFNESAPAENSLTEEDITNYIKENIHDFDTELLIQATADLPNESILQSDDFSEEEINQMMDEILNEVDEKTLEEML